MIPILLPNGNLLIPVRAEGDDVVGDTWREITPADPDYEQWLAEIKDDTMAIISG